MDVLATKDHYELETEETERLVRPAPKVKPPRHDKMREDVHERDPDTDGDPDLKADPDMSVNYKNVGGSLVERVLARFATEPKDKQDKPKSNKWVKVRNKVLDVGTRVRPETLIEEPSLYEKKKPNDPPLENEGKPRPARKPQRPHYHKDPIPHPPWPDPRPQPKKPPRKVQPPKPVKPVPVRRYPEPETMPKPKPPGWVPERRKSADAVVVRFLQATEFPSDEALKKYLKDHPDADPKEHSVKKTEDMSAEEEWATVDDKGNLPGDEGYTAPKKVDYVGAGRALHEQMKADPPLNAMLKSVMDPAETLGGVAKGNPTKLVRDVLPKLKVPEGIKTMGDLLTALQEGDKALKAEPKPKAEKPAKKPKKEEAILEGVVPEAKKEPAEEANQKEEPKEEPGPGEEAKPKEEPEKAKGPQPKRRKVSPVDQKAMEQDIAMNFPLAVASKLMAAKLHPDDYQKIKASAIRASQVPVQRDQLDKLVENVRKLPGGGDPTKVPAPKQARDAKGEMVPFETLPKEEQAEAWAQYRNEVVAAHIGARIQTATAYRKAGMPGPLAQMMATAKLGGHDTKAHMQAAFDNVLNSGKSDELTPKARQKLVEKLGDDDQQHLAASYFQAQDYLDARKQFLDENSPEGISERSSMKQIKDALQMGSSMLNERSKHYPVTALDNVGQLFRQRLVSRLEALDPHKAIIAQRTVDELDADDYDKAKKSWTKADMQHKADMAKREKKREKIREKLQAKEDAGPEGYRDKAETKTVEELWAEADLSPEKDPPPPEAPKKPARYDLLRGTLPKARDQHQELFEQGEEPEKPEKPVGEDEKPPSKTKQASWNPMPARVVGRFLAFSTCAG